MSLTKHGIFSFICDATLSRQQIHDFSDLLTQLGEPLHDIIFVGELVQDLLDHVPQLVENSVLKVDKVLLVRLVRHLMHQVFDVLAGPVFMLLEFRSQSRKLI